MLIFEAWDAHGNRVHTPCVTSFEIRQSTQVPADILQVVFTGEIKEEIAKIHVLSQDEKIFEGIVDEQITQYSKSTSTLIVARSTEALLIDNEAEPQNFVNPSFSVIFKKYLSPLGIREYRGRNLTLKGDFNVRKGMSCMQVLADFAKRTYGFVPKIQGGEIILSDESMGDKIVFSDEKSDPACVMYESLEKSLLRYNLLSEIRVRAGEDSRYSITVKDEEAQSRGIVRVRYLDCAEKDSVYTNKTRQMISSARLGEKKFRLTLKGFCVGILSHSAEIHIQDKIFEGLCVDEVKYTFKNNREYTSVTLVRKEL